MFRLYINGRACKWTRETKKELKKFINIFNAQDKKASRPLAAYTIKEEK